MNIHAFFKSRSQQRKHVQKPRAQLGVEVLENRTMLTLPAWFPIGPAPILNGQTSGDQPVTGRLTAVAADPKNPNIIYVAAASGGVWKTTDGGKYWQPVTDDRNVDWGGVQPVDFMGALAVAKSN